MSKGRVWERMYNAIAENCNECGRVIEPGAERYQEWVSGHLRRHVECHEKAEGTALSDEAVSLCIDVVLPANICQNLIELLGSVETAKAFIKASATEAALPTPEERRLLVVGDSDRGGRIHKSLLAMARISGAMSIGFGVPREGFRAFDDQIERANREISKAILGQTVVTARGFRPLSVGYHPPPGGLRLDTYTPPAQEKRRPLVDRKARRAKRKQRRNR